MWAHDRSATSGRISGRSSCSDQPLRWLSAPVGCAPPGPPQGIFAKKKYVVWEGVERRRIEAKWLMAARAGREIGSYQPRFSS